MFNCVFYFVALVVCLKKNISLETLFLFKFFSQQAKKNIFDVPVPYLGMLSKYMKNLQCPGF